MGRVKKKESVEQKQCSCCGQIKHPTKDYYSSEGIMYKASKRLCVCSDCVLELFLEYAKQYNSEKKSAYHVCRLIDKCYKETVFNTSMIECHSKGSTGVISFQSYMKTINSLPQYRGLTFRESDPEPEVVKPDEKKVYNITGSQVMTSEDDKNKQDVCRLLGYDPFEGENEDDKKFLYNKLIDYLDESTLEDSFKIPAVIEIVKSFNQIDKINRGLATITIDPERVANSVGGIKSLIDAKNTMMKTILALAKDNGISVNYSTKKSRGAGTLSGIIKKLQEIGLESAEVNLFDVETSEGIRQVADISNESIKKQLMFDENDYTEMLAQQRELIENLDKSNITLDEENRKIKIKLQNYEKKYGELI